MYNTFHYLNGNPFDTARAGKRVRERVARRGLVVYVASDAERVGVRWQKGSWQFVRQVRQSSQRDLECGGGEKEQQ